MNVPILIYVIFLIPKKSSYSCRASCMFVTCNLANNFVQGPYGTPQLVLALDPCIETNTVIWYSARLCPSFSWLVTYDAYSSGSCLSTNANDDSDDSPQ